MPTYDQYWHAIREEVAATDQDWQRIPTDETVRAHGLTWRVDRIRLSSVSDSLIHAWYCVPADHEPTKVGVLWLPGYSYGTPPPDHNALTAGACVMGVNVHGNSADAEYTNPTGKADYITKGLPWADRYIYRAICCHCLRALAVLAAQPEVHQERLATAGMSQGGMLALITAAQQPEVGACFADMPFLADNSYGLEYVRGGAYRVLRDYISAHADADREIRHTLALFDPMVHAPHITCPVWLTAGGRDPSVRPATVEAVYARLASRYKEYRLFPVSGHDFVPEMAASRERWLRSWNEIRALD